MLLFLRNIFGLVSILTFVLISCGQSDQVPLEKAKELEKQATKNLIDDEYDTSIKQYTELIKLNHPEINYAKVYINRSGSFLYSGQNEKALSDAKKAEILLKDNPDPRLEAILYLRYGKLYLLDRNYEMSNYYYKRGSELDQIKKSEAAKFKYRLANNLKLIGNDSCFIYYWSILNERDSISKSTFSKTLGAICGAYMKVGENGGSDDYEVNDSIQYYCDTYFKNVESSGKLLSSFFLKKAKYYYHFQEHDKALQNSLASIDYYLTHENDDPDYYNDLIGQHIRLQLKIYGDTLLVDKFQEFRDTTISLRKKTARVEKLRQALTIAEKEKDLAISETTNRNYLILLLLALLAGVFLYLRNKSAKNRNRFLESEKLRIEEEHEKLDLLNAELVSQINDLEENSKPTLPLSEIEKIPVVFQLRNRTKKFLKQNEIEYIVWAGDIATLYTFDDQQFEVRDSIPQFFKRYLHPHIFIQANKSVVVRIGAIEGMKGKFIVLKKFPNRKVEWGNPYKANAEELLNSLLH